MNDTRRAIKRTRRTIIQQQQATIAALVSRQTVAWSLVRDLAEAVQTTANGNELAASLASALQRAAKMMLEPPA